MAPQVFKGRGAASRPAGRYAAQVVEPEAGFDESLAPPETVLRPITARSIVSSNNSPDIPFDRSINPYLGCEHGCVYCYARPGHSYLDLSPGLDFETQIFYKPNAVEALLTEWSRASYECKPITIGANTDPYQPAEKQLGITRKLLVAFLQHRHPVSLITKGALMARDLDLLAQLADRGLCSVAVSVPTMDDQLKRVLEPRVPSASVRFRLIQDLQAAGVPVSLLMAPIIPAVNDAEIESVIERAANSGAGHATWILLRLPHELKQIFVEWLELHMPQRAGHVMSLLRQASGGKDYDNRFGIRQRGRGPYADMINQRFKATCTRHGIGAGRTRIQLDCSRFRPPGGRQLALDFD
jgi:DNA repair photolyase